jgi:hypothetical protein
MGIWEQKIPFLILLEKGDWDTYFIIYFDKIIFRVTTFPPATSL